MGLTTVEILCRANGECITAYPSPHKWGRGDMPKNFVFCVDLDLPCYVNRKYTRQDKHVGFGCKKCEHSGIVWLVNPPIDGTKGYVKKTCPIQKYLSAYVEHTWHVYKNQEWKTTEIIQKRAYVIASPTLSQVSKDTTLTDKLPLITTEEVELKLYRARKPENKITENDIQVNE